MIRVPILDGRSWQGTYLTDDGKLLLCEMHRISANPQYYKAMCISEVTDQQVYTKRGVNKTHMNFFFKAEKLPPMECWTWEEVAHVEWLHADSPTEWPHKEVI